MDAVTAAVGFIGGAVSVGCLLLRRIAFWPKRDRDDMIGVLRNPLPAADLQIHNELTNDKRELLRINAIKEGKEIGREEARQELEKLHAVQVELVKQNAYTDGYVEGKKEGMASYVVDIQPFYKKKSGVMIGFKKYEYTFGYNYQLFVNGMPCFEPFERIVKTETDTQIDSDELEKRVKGLMESVVSGALSGVTNGLTANLNVGKLIEKK